MSTPELGRWEPLSLTDTVEMFATAPFRWWISGGRALELHLGRSWRVHSDTDVGVVRSDVAQLRSLLAGWDVHVAAAGRLAPWNGEQLDAAGHQNNLWCRRARGEPWAVDVTIGDGDGDEWIFRRDPRVRAAWEHAVLVSDAGIPYLAPELQLLFKSTNLRPKDDVDAEHVLPALEPERRDRLAHLLPPDHPWQSRLGAG